jgi:hypothetical protein
MIESAKIGAALAAAKESKTFSSAVALNPLPRSLPGPFGGTTHTDFDHCDLFVFERSWGPPRGVKPSC